MLRLRRLRASLLRELDDRMAAMESHPDADPAEMSRRRAELAAFRRKLGARD